MIPEATEPSTRQRLVADDGTPDGEALRLRRLAMTGAPAPRQMLVVQVGPKFTTGVRTAAERQLASFVVSHAPVMLAASQAAAARATGGAAARVLRAAAQQVVERARIEALREVACPVVGTAGIARAVITLGSAGGSKATRDQVHGATDTLAIAWVEEKKDGQSRPWVEPMMIGSAVLGAILECLGANEIAAEAEAPLDGTLDTD